MEGQNTDLWSLIVIVVGFFFIVAGFIAQTSNANFWNWWALVYYLIGFFLWAQGKHACHSGSHSMGREVKARTKRRKK